MPGFTTRSFVTVFLLSALVPLFQSAPISYPENEGVHPRLSYPDEPSVHPREQGEPHSPQRRSLHPADVNVNAGMLPRSLHAQVPLNSAIEPRSLDAQEHEGLVRRHLHAQVPLNAEIEPREQRIFRRHLYAQVPLNAEIEPREQRIFRRSLYAQVPLNAQIEPRGESRLERRAGGDEDEAEGSEHHELKLPHNRKSRLYTRAREGDDFVLSRRTIIPFTVKRLFNDLNWRPRIRPFQSVPSWTFSAPGFKSHHIQHAATHHHGSTDQYARKKILDDPTEFIPPTRSSALVLQPREPKAESWSVVSSSHSEERIVNGHRDAKAQELFAWRAAHSPSEAEAKKNGGKPVESGEAILVTAETPKEGSGAKGSGKPKVTVDVAVLGDKKPKEEKKEEKKDAAEDSPAKSASPSGAGAGEGEDLSEGSPKFRRWFDDLGF